MQSQRGTNQIFFWALNGDYQSLRSALESGANVNMIDPVTTDSPLMIACRKGHSDIVRLCLHFGGKNDPHPEFGQTALHAAVSERQLGAANVLLEAAAQSDADSIISNLSDPSGQTPLHGAASIGSTEMAELLLQHGARLTSIDKQGRTPLHLCASSGNKVCLALLLDHGGDEQLEIPDNGGNTALHHASYNGRLECVRLLLETAADVHARNYQGQTAYNIASSQGHQQIGLLLLEYRDIHPTSSSFNNPNLSPRGEPGLLQTPIKGPYPPYQSPGHSPAYVTPQHGPSGNRTSPFLLPESHSSPELDQLHGADRSYGIGGGHIALSIGPNESLSPRAYLLNNATMQLGPVNSATTMLGLNGGMEHLDSMGNYLPRPHTVHSPMVSGRVQNSSSAMGSTPLGAGAQRLKRSTSVSSYSEGNGSGSGSATLEEGALDTGYRVLPKNSPSQAPASGAKLGPQKPSAYSRQTSEPGGSQGRVDPAASMQLFEGIQVYTKQAIVSQQQYRGITRSADFTHDTSALPRYPANSGAHTSRHGSIYDEQPHHDGPILVSNSVDAKLSRSRSFTQGSYFQESILAATATDGLSSTDYLMMEHKSTGETPVASPTKASSAVPTYDHHLHQGQHAGAGGPAMESETLQEGEIGDDGGFADPLEEFDCLGRHWAVYLTEESHVYYLDMAHEHSQWEDPRDSGLVIMQQYGEGEDASIAERGDHLTADADGGGEGYIRGGSPRSLPDSPASLHSYKGFEPPKSPTLKTAEKVRRPHDKTGFRSSGNKEECGDEDEDGASSGDDDGDGVGLSAVPVRYPNRRPPADAWTATSGAAARATGTSTGADASEDGPGSTTSSGKCLFSGADDDEEEEVERADITSSVEDSVTAARRDNRTDFEGKLEICVTLDERASASAGGGRATADSADKENNGAATKRAEGTSSSGNSALRSISRHSPPASPTVSTCGSAERVAKGHMAPAGKVRSHSHSPPNSPPKLPLKATGTRGPSPAAELTVKERLLTSAGATRAAAASASSIRTAEPVENGAQGGKGSSEPATSSASSAFCSPEAEPTVEESQPYVDMLRSGHSLREVGERLEADGRSQHFKLHVLALADEILLEEEQRAQHMQQASFQSPPGKSSQRPISGGGNGNTTEEADQSEETVPKETVADLKTDSLLKKYAKMLALGVAAGNVLSKMKLDDVPVDQRNRLMRAAGHEEEPDPTAAAAAAAAKASRKGSSTISLHWNTLPAEKLKNSIWSFQDQHDMEENDLKELERLFCAAPESFATSRSVGMVSEAQKDMLTLKLLEKRRAQNITIGLVPFKGFGSHVELLKAVCSLDDFQGRMTVDHLDNLKNLLPTDVEWKVIDRVEGSKHPAELFFQAAMRFYPELPHRLHCFSSCLAFTTQAEAAIARAKIIINACNQVLSSSKLARLLKKMLAVGNAMNQGTARGEASGFTLDSLMKMVNTKGVDKKTSVLDYVVKSLYDKDEEEVLEVLGDLSLVEETCKLSGIELRREFDGLAESLETLAQAHRRNKQELMGNPTHNSPAAKMMIDDFNVRLGAYLERFSQWQVDLEKTKSIMNRKVTGIAEYFGEDKSKCDTMQIFSVLHEFLRALAFSKAALEWKLYRGQA